MGHEHRRGEWRKQVYEFDIRFESQQELSIKLDWLEICTACVMFQHLLFSLYLYLVNRLLNLQNLADWGFFKINFMMGAGEEELKTLKLHNYMTGLDLR